MVNPKPEILAVIPARGGSKGIPRKNIKVFAGYPLLAYSVQAALDSQYVTRTIVSTDDQEIAAVARKFGAEVPFLRDPKFAKDDTLDFPVFENLLAVLKKEENYQPDFVVQLRPTSPIRPVDLVDKAIELIMNNPQVDSVRGVVPSGQNPYKMWRIDAESGLMTGLLSVPGVAEPYNSARQLLPDTFWQTGHIDVIRTVVITEKKSMSGEKILPVFIDPDYTVDLDKLSDWQRAEWQVWHSGLKMVSPGRKRRNLPEKTELVVFDFDGVMTDDRVYVNQEGVEMVAANRKDGMGISALQHSGVKTLIISSEENPVVSTRANKLRIPVLQGIKNKAPVLENYLVDNGFNPAKVVYLGNDVNDLPCFSLVGCAVSVADGHAKVLREADIILKSKGGHGAVRELCDMIIDLTKETAKE